MFYLPGRSVSWSGGGGGGGPTFGRAISVDFGSSVVSAAATVGPINGGYPNWQQFTEASGVAGLNLEDDQGNPTTCDLTRTHQDANQATLSTDDASDDYDLFIRGMGSDNGADTVLSWAQIPYSKYDAVVVVDVKSGWTSTTRLMSVTDGTTTYYWQVNGTGRWGGSWVQITSTSSGSPDTGAQNYVYFTGLTSTSLTINMNQASGLQTWGLIVAAQLVERTD